MGTHVYIDPAVTSHKDGTLKTVTIDNITVTP
jgi:hypothetical protein